MSQPTDPLMQEAEAAQYLGMKSSTLRQWRYQARGPAYHKFGSRVFYRVSDIERFMEQSRVSIEPGA